MINKFREYAIFDNLIANQLCDELVSVLAPSESEYPTNILLTGAAAYALQTEYNNEVHNIVFKVIENEPYVRLINYLDRISAKELTRYANRTYFKFQAGNIELCFMIMFETTETSSVDYNGIKLEAITFINPELL